MVSFHAQSFLLTLALTATTSISSVTCLPSSATSPTTSSRLLRLLARQNSAPPAAATTTTNSSFVLAAVDINNSTVSSNDNTTNPLIPNFTSNILKGYRLLLADQPNALLTDIIAVQPAEAASRQRHAYVDRPEDLTFIREEFVVNVDATATTTAVANLTNLTSTADDNNNGNNNGGSGTWTINSKPVPPAHYYGQWDPPQRLQRGFSGAPYFSPRNDVPVDVERALEIAREDAGVSGRFNRIKLAPKSMGIFRRGVPRWTIWFEKATVVIDARTGQVLEVDDRPSNDDDGVVVASS